MSAGPKSDKLGVLNVIVSFNCPLAGGEAGSGAGCIRLLDKSESGAMGTRD